MPEPPNPNFVFRDTKGKRWPRTRLLFLLCVVFLFLGAVLFVQSLQIAPQIQMPFELKQVKQEVKLLQTAHFQTQTTRNWLRFEHHETPPNAAATPKPKPSPPVTQGPIRLGYYVGWDPNCTASLVAHANKLTHVCPEWFTLSNPGSTLSAEKDCDLLQILEQNKNLTLMPRLSNLVNDTRQPEPVENLVRSDEGTQGKFIDDLVNRLVNLKAGGVVLDWEGVDPAYQEQITAFCARLSDQLHRAGMQLWLQVQMGEELRVYDLDGLIDSVDYFVALLDDQNSDSDPPGPIAGQDWVDGWLHTIESYEYKNQWIIALGAYGYDWPEGKKAASISFPDAMSRAAYIGQCTTTSEAPSFNPTFDYTLSGVSHHVWFLDAVTFLDQARDAHAHGFKAFAIDRLGTEDPHIWDTLDLIAINPLQSDQLKKLEPLDPGKLITNIGKGEIVTVDNAPESGFRELSINNEGRINAVYQKFPQYPNLYHQGASGPHDVAITFDDGPDPEWTPKILDILKEKSVPATFFLVGKQVESYPSLVKREVKEGHELGNHTYYHSNLAICSDWQIRTELNATQRVIEEVTGRSTTFFRPPYDADSQPTDVSELTAIAIAQRLGYLTVLENIDPEDWARPGSDVILQRVKQQRRNGNIILLHDAGGNRSQTVKALPKIIDYLRERDDVIVPLGQLLNLSRDAVNPYLNPENQQLARWTSSLSFQAIRTVIKFLWAFMLVATALVLLRMLIIVLLVVKRKIKGPTQVRVTDNVFAPDLSIVIAAYNEEKVIATTLCALVHTHYKGNIEIIVVNDGSKDQTAEVIEHFKTQFESENPRSPICIRLLQQSNRGKSVALSQGVSAASAEILVFLDADTLFNPETLTELVKMFADPKVGAISGHARVGNLRTFIAQCQSIEYICGFNLDRAAYDYWSCITVAPGAVSAFRQTAIKEAGGFLTDTLAEDTDLTLSLHRCGWKVGYAKNAVAYTEAPETIRALAKQRFRWCFGTMQCLWKHRDMLFNPKFKQLGFFSLPSIWIFQIFLVAMTPIVDLILLLAVFAGNTKVILPYLVAFLVLDQILALIACKLEKEPLKQCWIVIPMRLIYRPLLSWVVWKSIITAIKGALVGWGKLERTASVTLPSSENFNA